MTTIYHYPACAASGNFLAMICNSGEAPTIVGCLRYPPGHEQLVKLIRDAGLTVREALRQKCRSLTDRYSEPRECAANPSRRMNQTVL